MLSIFVVIWNRVWLKIWQIGETLFHLTLLDKYFPPKLSVAQRPHGLDLKTKSSSNILQLKENMISISVPFSFFPRHCYWLRERMGVPVEERYAERRKEANHRVPSLI